MLLAQMWGSLRFGLSSPSLYSKISAHPAALLGFPDVQTACCVSLGCPTAGQGSGITALKAVAREQE